MFTKIEVDETYSNAILFLKEGFDLLGLIGDETDKVVKLKNARAGFIKKVKEEENSKYQLLIDDIPGHVAGYRKRYDPSHVFDGKFIVSEIVFVPCTMELITDEDCCRIGKFSINLFIHKIVESDGGLSKENFFSTFLIEDVVYRKKIPANTKDFPENVVLIEDDALVKKVGQLTKSVKL